MKIPHSSFSGYGSLLKGAWQTMWRRPIVFFPSAYSYGGFILLSLLMLGLVSLVFGSIERIDLYTPASIAAFFLLGGLLFFLFGSHATAVQIAFYRKVVMDKQISIKRAFLDANKLFGRVALFFFYLFLLAIPLVVVVLILLLFMGFVQQGNAADFIMFALGFTSLMILVFFVMIGAWLTFKYPLLGFTDLSAWQVIREMWRLLFYDTKHVWLTYLIYLGLWIGIAILISVFGAVIGIPSDNALKPAWWNIVTIMINILLSVWFGLYMFKSFVARYKPKVK